MQEWQPWFLGFLVGILEADYFWRMELGGRVGRERGSSEEQLKGCKGDPAGLSCYEHSAHAIVAPVESDTGGAALHLWPLLC